MIDLVKWLERQLDEDERIARATMLTSTDKGEWTVTADPRSGDDKPTGVLGTCIHIGMIGGNGDLDDPAQAIHIAEHDPARVLREVEAKRALLHDCVHTLEVEDYGYTLADKTIRRLASVYSDRPGFKDEWRIES